MFLMLAQVVRLHRVKRGLTQQQLASLARVSRRQLAQLEQGENVSLRFLVKIARVLDLKELPLDGLRLHAVPPQISAIVEAAHALAAAKDAIAAIAASGEEIAGVSTKLDALLDRALAGTPSDPRVEEFADALKKLPADEHAPAAATLRAMGSDRVVRRRRAARKPASKVPSRSRRRAR